MSGSDAQQVAYTATLFREAAHEWYISFERQNRGPPKDWAMLVAALLDRFGSNIPSSGSSVPTYVYLTGEQGCA